MKSVKIYLFLIITFPFAYSIKASKPDDSDWIFVGPDAGTQGAQSIIASGNKGNAQSTDKLTLKQQKLSKKRNPFAHAPQVAKDKMREALLAAKKKQPEEGNSDNK